MTVYRPFKSHLSSWTPIQTSGQKNQDEPGAPNDRLIEAPNLIIENIIAIGSLAKDLEKIQSCKALVQLNRK